MESMSWFGLHNYIVGICGCVPLLLFNRRGLCNSTKIFVGIWCPSLKEVDFERRVWFITFVDFIEKRLTDSMHKHNENNQD